MATNPSGPPDRNRAAVVSLWLALVFPIALLLTTIIYGSVAQPQLTSALHLLSVVLIPLSLVLDLAGVVALFAAVVVGHQALRHARDLPARQARRGLAVAGLVLGYVELTLFLALAALAIWAYTHPNRMHLVF